MRRWQFIGAGTLGATAFASGGRAPGADAESVPGGTHLVERLADFDRDAFAQRVERPAAAYRQVWDAVAFQPGILNNVKNSLNGLEFGFGIPPGEIAMTMVVHGPSAAYTYSDRIWQRFRIGEFIGAKDPATGAFLTANVFHPRRSAPDGPTDPDDARSPYQDASISALQSRGVVFLTCHTAVEEQSRALVARGFAPSGMQPAQVAAEILTHLVPGAMVVPSGVATIQVLQTQYRYAYITVQ